MILKSSFGSSELSISPSMEMRKTKKKMLWRNLRWKKKINHIRQGLTLKIMLRHQLHHLNHLDNLCIQPLPQLGKVRILYYELISNNNLK